jgi:hypothetical protein
VLDCPVGIDEDVLRVLGHWVGPSLVLGGRA